MARKITLNPVTRIEGHAKVDLEIGDSNNVSAAVFQVLDFRGFESFLEGMQAEMMPTITARICGTCPHTHHLAAARAIDKAYGAEITHTAWLLRNILNLASVIHSHAVHFFVLAGPDFFLDKNAPPEKRNIIGMVEEMPELSKMALRLRSIGQLICEIVGGRGTHPVTMVAGGVSKSLNNDEVAKIRELAREGLEIGERLFEAGKIVLLERELPIPSLHNESAYFGTVKNGVFDLYDGSLKLLKADGAVTEIEEDVWERYLKTDSIEKSYSKKVCFEENGQSIAYRVGPLARLNCADTFDTPRAQAELEEFRDKVGWPCHETVRYHYARLVELLYAVEKCMELCGSKEVGSTDVRVPLSSPKSACAHVEAPRGTLLHDYQIDANGIVKRAKLLVATQQNISGINETIRMSAELFIDKGDEELLNAVELGIRCYDPCLSCATHRLGEMRLDIGINHNGTLIRRVRR